MQDDSRSAVRATASFLGMVLGTTIVGLGFGLAAGLALAFVLRDTLFGFGALTGAFLGVIAGYPVGVIVGIVIAHRLIRYRGSPWLGLLGTALATASIIVLFIEPLEQYVYPTVVFSVFFAGAPIFGTIGFHLRRKRNGPD